MQHSLPQPLQNTAEDAHAHAHDRGHVHGAGHVHNDGIIDRFGAFLGFACALHCIFVPLLFGVLPALGLGFLADHAFDLTIVAIASICAVFAARSGWRAHRDVRVMWGFAGAISLLVLGHLLGEEALVGRVPSALGGIALAVTHIANLRLSKKACAHAD